MRLLILAYHYLPDLGPSAPLFTMLCECLAQRGHEVTVITTVPHYPSGEVPREFQGKPIRRTLENGVQVMRVGLPSIHRSNLQLRFLQFACFQLGATWAGLTQDADAILVTNPALQAWLPFVWFTSIRRTPAIFSIHDVYPDVGVNLGIFRHKAVVAMVSILERYCLEHASRVRILSESFKPGLRALGVPDEKMSLVYDWVDTDLVRPTTRHNSFALEHQLCGRFVVLYAGNLGLSQGLEIVLAAAQSLSDQPEIQFVLVGDGAARQDLMEQADQLGLSNVLFLPFQPRQRLPEVLASADVSLVTLRHGIGLGSLPSKVFSILASGRPIIACIDENCETWELITRSEAGYCVPPEDPDRLVEAIHRLKNDPDRCVQFGANGRKWAEEYHSPYAATLQFEKLFQQIISHNGTM